MDYFTKWPEAYVFPNQKAGVVAQAFVEGFVCSHGIPEELHTDQGRNFESHLLKEVCSLFVRLYTSFSENKDNALKTRI